METYLFSVVSDLARDWCYAMLLGLSILCIKTVASNRQTNVFALIIFSVCFLFIVVMNVLDTLEEN